MLSINPGNAIAMQINSHRTGWNGVICANASTWECGAKTEFRQLHCERGDPRCYHLHAFDERDPRFGVHSSGAAWLLDADPEALNDQVLLLYNRPFREPQGIDASGPRTWRVYGLYRILRVDSTRHGAWNEYTVLPHAESWLRLDQLDVVLPRFRNLSGSYIREVDGKMLLDQIIPEAQRKMEHRSNLRLDQRTARRFDEVMSAVPEWLRVAGTKVKPRPAVRTVAEIGGTEVRKSPFDQLAAHVVEDRRAAPDAAPEPAPDAPDEEPPPAVPVAKAPAEPVPARGATLGERSERPSREPDARAPIDGVIEPTMRPRIEADYGPELLRTLEIATLTKPLVILRGGPGVGKSTLACRLIDDPEGTRTSITPVVSTWRGREDLLGYVNPMDGRFQATPFTSFLIRAERAWDAGDHRTHLAILEELNLSQPEYWLSDILVRMEYPAENRAQRTIHLGGAGVALPGEEARTEVYLTPAVRFVATLNTDHTTRKLSPRVLDRAAIIVLGVDPQTAFQRLQIELESAQVEAIEQLDYLVNRKGAAFSYRSARSLQRCLALRESLDLTVWQVIDHVLVHEVLSKIRLMAGDANDQAFIELAMEWYESYSRWLPLSTRLLESWKEALEEDRDVEQA